MSGNSAFDLVSERGWRRGMGNMLKNEFARWWKTSRWWTQCLIWAGILGLMMGAMLFGPDKLDFPTALMVFSLFAGLFPGVAVIIIMQDVLVGEKQEGTAAWVLSKPVTRQAFIIPKIIANSVGVLVTMVIVPCTVGYAILSISQKTALDPLRFLAAMGVIFVSHFFFLNFAMMLSTFINSRGPVIGLSISLLFFQQYLVGFSRLLGFMLPFNLVVALGEQPSSLVLSLLNGTPLHTDHLITLGVVLAETVVFIFIGLWRFNREEF
jgi:ABC-2 type transport system permease protein